MTLDTWKTVENTEDFSNIIYREGDIIHNSPQDSLEKSMGCYNAPWGVALHRYCWDKLKGVIDMNLGETYSYSRKYERGAYLKAHADRPSCEISATLCLEYQSDDERPWPIWVDNSTDCARSAHSPLSPRRNKPFTANITVALLCHRLSSREDGSAARTTRGACPCSRANASGCRPRLRACWQPLPIRLCPAALCMAV